METIDIISALAASRQPVSKSKRRNILYRILTGIFATAMLLDGISGVARVEAGREVMAHLGYPAYLLTIVGGAKVLGVLALVQPRFRILKEWAYAGFTINFIGAALSWAFVDGKLKAVLPPLAALTFLLIVYYLGRKVEQPKPAADKP